MGRLRNAFVTGVLTIVPLVVTMYILYWLSTMAEQVLGGLIQVVVPRHVYRPGMGIGAGIGIALVVGVMMQAWVVRRLFEWGERQLLRVPIFKAFYGSIKDLTHFASKPGLGLADGDNARKVVMVRIGGGDTEVLGFITRTDFAGAASDLGDESRVAVYVPMSYQIGGHMLIVPRSSVRTVSMPVSQAMRFAVTGGMTTGPPR